MSHEDISYRATLDHLLEGFQILGPDLTYLYVNPAAAAQGRRTVAELTGRRMAELYPGIEASPLYAQLTRVLDDRVPVSTENHFEHADGTWRWFELRIEPVPEGVCVHSLDIDERKRAELERARLNEELEERIKLRTRELEEANRELEAFAYSVSHDLRSPLRAIDGFAQALEEDCGQALGPSGARYLGRIRAGAQKMGALIDDMLKLSRVSRTSVERRRVDVTALVRTIASDLALAEPSRKVTWHVEDGLAADCDPQLARIAFENLLGNAWKFTRRRDEAHVSVTRDAARASGFVVADDGAGFDMAYADKLFVPFQRLHHEREFPGTGIGLATVQRIVQKHGGALRAVGEVDRGAHIAISFAPDG